MSPISTNSQTHFCTVFLHSPTASLMVSYPGYCIAKLRQEYPGEFFTFLLGPAGDNSPHFVRKARDYAEMVRLAELLRQEFDRQLKLQKPEEARPVSLKFEETTIPKELIELTEDMLDIPEDLNEEEERLLRRFRGEDFRGNHFNDRTIRDFEYVDKYHLAHLILSPDYSIIFEPFELYSEYYGAVDKRKCTIATISHGFEHYLTGWYMRRLSMHGSLLPFSNTMRKRMWEIFGRWSRQEKLG